MTQEGRGFIDASPYMLFEASGDSEGGAWDLDSDAPAPAPADDDAQSCSYGSVGYCESKAVVVVDASLNASVNPTPEYGLRSYFEDEEDEDEEDDNGVVDQCAAADKEAAAVKSKGWEESNAEKINDREGDRQFWEMCLAS